MKKLFLTSAVILAMFSMGSTSSKIVQCGVSNQQIADYLANGPHNHVVHSVSDIPGTCNSSASCDCNTTSTVYVSDGIIVGHADASGRCAQ